MANMKDIAERAGVSVTTVSKVLNHQGNISAETAKQIRDIAKELNYIPNLYARNLKMGKSRVLGIITEDLTVFNAAPVIDGIGARCEEAGYHYILENLRINQLKIDPETHTDEYNAIVSEAMDFMKSMQVDGVIFLGCHSHHVMSLPEINHTKFVCAYCSSDSPAIPAVMYDDRQAGYDVATYLIQNGHRKIGVLAGPLHSIHTVNRLDGYQEALFDNQLPYNPHLTVYGDWERDSGFHLAGGLLSQKVTAIFCQNDVMAMGVMDYCSRNGITVGRDLSLIGFDDRDIASVCRPALSTVSLPLYEIGHKAADLLMKRIAGEDDPNLTEVLLPCKIVIRESSSVLK